MALMHMRVYYKYCKSSTQNLAHFRRTIVGPEVTSLVETSGTCVRNAVSVSVSLAEDFLFLMYRKTPSKYLSFTS